MEFTNSKFDIKIEKYIKKINKRSWYNVFFLEKKLIKIIEKKAILIGSSWKKYGVPKIIGNEKKLVINFMKFVFRPTASLNLSIRWNGSSTNICE